MLIKKYKILILLGIASLFFNNCSTVGKAFDPQRKNNSEEFLVEKKSPLSMPPDFDELPVPQNNGKNQQDQNTDIELLITKTKKDNNQKIDSENTNKNFLQLLLDKIKNN
jgi:hypothetical protein